MPQQSAQMRKPSFSTMLRGRVCQPGTGKHTLHCLRRSFRRTYKSRPASSDGIPIAPGMLRDFRASHTSPGPCCLCPCMSTKSSTFIEAAIVVGTEDPWRGQYLALCASGTCSYIGEYVRIRRGAMKLTGCRAHTIVCLDRIFSNPGLVVQIATIRGNACISFGRSQL